MAFYWAFVLLLIYSIDHTNGVCIQSLTLDHGKVTYKDNGFSVLFECDPDYILQGNAELPCNEDGRITELKPFCAKSGCKLENESITNLKLEVSCPNADLFGHSIAYCDGEKWSNELGTCYTQPTPAYSCNFENMNRCHWMPFPYPSLWNRVSDVTHFHYAETGPFTESESYGYYMRMLTGRGNSSDRHHLLSPTYPKEFSQQNACFSFSYYMFGRGVDSLEVSVAPDSNPINGTIWKRIIAESQAAKWLTLTIPIPKMEQDFKVVFTGKHARRPFGDIAIDDVKLMSGESCPQLVGQVPPNPKTLVNILKP
ncbi:MAM and LDL-receptor class A domain-containing protein 1-like [Drosophila subpulchrella]|uniref:MAM and LDL-receptor class A domain-containing protein 1-like n=1 Tax=Drosophila subpulchrella TaxID=1486046 RepID=UPI0018A16B8C|nr:MAM and LDL-receptor class A domain-containing protein 1-like [Drosophila subpulchrella]